MKTCIMLGLALVCGALWGEDLVNDGGYVFSDVTAKTRAPWQETCVDLAFTLAAPEGGDANAPVEVAVVASNGCERVDLGDFFQGLYLKPGQHHLMWDMGDVLAGRMLAHLRFYLSVVATDVKPAYLLVDLATGEQIYRGAAFSNTVNTVTAYKTRYMAFRYIPATTSDEWKAMSGGVDSFTIGSPEDEPYRSAADAAREAHVPIRLTKGFWLGVYPVTCGQYRQLGFTPPSYYGEDDGETVAARGLSYNAVRGSDGRDNGFCFGKDVDAQGRPAVDSTRYIGRLRTLTGLGFDLPSEAQWEYACRAGTTTLYWFPGENVLLNSVAGAIARPSWTRTVGTAAPNAFGLYDMVGCVHQWTTTLGKWADGSDWCHVAADDPVGPVADSNTPKRITRGSHYGALGAGGTDWQGNAISEVCRRVYRSAYRYAQNVVAAEDSEWELPNCGFRLYLPEE